MSARRRLTIPYRAGEPSVWCPLLLVLDDEVRDWKGEAIEGGCRASLLEPAGFLVSECDDDQFIRREGPKRVLDRLHRVGTTNPRLNVVARCRLRKLVGPLGRIGAGVVVGVCHPLSWRSGLVFLMPR